MGLLTVPAQFTASTLTPTQLNTLMNTIYNDYGTTTNNQGNIVDANISLTAAITRTKVADTSVVCGNTYSPGIQTISRPTVFLGGALSIQSNSYVGNVETVASAGALAINPSLLYHVVTGTTGVSTVTGASSEGTRMVLVANGVITFTHTATDTLNSLKLNGISGTAPSSWTATGAAALTPVSKAFVYTKMNGAYANFQWVELPI